MSLSVVCPSCGARHNAPERAAGRTLKCMKCGEPLIVPELPPDEIGASYLLCEE